ncbi:cytochrome P450 [Hibiscus syriacus]|uniref:Cytochrome P450 n=1 Tax=Hibiscus syriacus TaxID=106335 RepID=A0A6A3AUR0_HIBSY|nr:cytochrome P450 [Hibiscus syriacus]
MNWTLSSVKTGWCKNPTWRIYSISKPLSKKQPDYTPPRPSPCRMNPLKTAPWSATLFRQAHSLGQNFEFIPFGSGRKVCPGISSALQILNLNLAVLLQSFEITTPDDEPVDIREGAGLTNLKAAPLNVVFTPRLPPHLYE